MTHISTFDFKVWEDTPWGSRIERCCSQQKRCQLPLVKIVMWKYEVFRVWSSSGTIRIKYEVVENVNLIIVQSDALMSWKKEGILDKNMKVPQPIYGRSQADFGNKAAQCQFSLILSTTAVIHPLSQSQSMVVCCSGSWMRFSILVCEITDWFALKFAVKPVPAVLKFTRPRSW